MSPMRKRHVLRTILETLGWADSYAVPEVALRSQVDGLVQPPTSDEEWQAAIAELSGEARGAIRQIEDSLDKDLVQWARTQRGKTLFETL